MDVTDSVDIDRVIATRGLADFVQIAWDQVESCPLVRGWHLDEVCDHLEAVSAGHIRKLIINVPPGFTKSLSVCVFWPVWDWITSPQRKFLFGSFDHGLTLRDSRRAKGLVESEWFQLRWEAPRVRYERDVPNTATEWWNLNGGWRFATSVGGKATGRHPDVRVIDDPTKPRDAMRSRDALETALKSAEDWYRGTLSSRQADPKTSSTVLIMQRLHQRDLAGILIDEEAEDWTHLRLPMRFESKHRCVTRWFLDDGTERTGGDRREDEGELLDPDRYDEKATSDLERDMGAHVAASQLQQRPTKAGGAIFRDEWMSQFWGVPDSPHPVLPGRIRQILVLDATFKGKPTGRSRRSYVCAQAWGISGSDCFLLDQERGQWELVETIAALQRLSKRWPKAFQKLIEDAANGPAIVSAAKKRIQGMKLVPTGGGSEARAQAVSPLFEAGNVWLPHPSIAPWVRNGRDGFIDELTLFPNAANDDQVDACSHALLHLGAGVAATYKAAMENI